jgi:putative flippase GtrA
MTGGLVALVAFATMTVLLTVFDVPGQLSLAITYLVSTTLHFALNRQWVWRGDGGYELHLTAQGRRYLLLVAASYATNAAALGWVPGWLDVPELAVYFVTTVLLAVASYVVLRHWVFGRASGTVITLPADP